MKIPDFLKNRIAIVAVSLICTALGIAGYDFTIHEGEEKAQTFTYQLDEKWVPENVSVVAFVYTNSGVAQVEKAKVVFTPVAPAV